MSAAAPDVEAPHDTPPRRRIWSRLFERELPRLPTEDFVPPPVQARAPSEPSEPDDDEWEWQIALARSRHATHPGV